MVQQAVDSKSTEHGSHANDTQVLAHDKHLPVAAKKTVLRDLQNVCRATVPSPTTDSLLSKSKGTTNHKLSGTKRPPESPASPHIQSPVNNAASGHLVYVRRKAEADTSNGSSSETARSNAESLNMILAGQVEEYNKSKYQMVPKVSYFPAVTPFPVSSPLSLSAKPSAPSPLGKPSPRLIPSEANNHPISYFTSSSCDPKTFKNLPWEERFDHLQVLLKKLDGSDQDYIQMLRSLSSVELSRLAVELERRSIQLSLEEAKELQRVSFLNVLGKSTPIRPLASSDHPELPGKMKKDASPGTV